MKHKKKQLNRKSHTYLSESIINKYCFKNAELIEKEKILQKRVNIYNKRFQFYHIKCKWKLQFVDTTIHVKSKRMYSNTLVSCPKQKKVSAANQNRAQKTLKVR